jgi:hypothetical protein
LLAYRSEMSPLRAVSEASQASVLGPARLFRQFL